MITTITTVTTVTTIAAMGLTAALSIAAIASLVIFLTTKELASANRSGPSVRIAKFAKVGIMPLAIAFGAILVTRIAELL